MKLIRRSSSVNFLEHTKQVSKYVGVRSTLNIDVTFLKHQEVSSFDPPLTWVAGSIKRSHVLQSSTLAHTGTSLCKSGKLLSIFESKSAVFAIFESKPVNKLT